MALIPHTAQVTTLGVRRPGDAVNLEVDVMAKYAERLLAGFLPAATAATAATAAADDTDHIDGTDGADSNRGVQP